MTLQDDTIFADRRRRGTVTDSSDSSKPQAANTIGLRTLPGRSAAAVAIGLVAGLGTLLLLGYLARPLALLFLALCISSAMAPPSRLLAKRMPRSTAIITAYVVLLLLIAAIIALLVTPLIAQIEGVSRNIPEFLERARQFLTDNGLSREQADGFIGQVARVGQDLISSRLSLVGGVLDGILVIIVSLYMLLDAPNLRRFILSLFANHQRSGIESVGTDMVDKIGGYVRGVAINIVLVSVITTIGLMLIGLPYALVLGITAGLFEALPVVGAIIAAIPILIVAILQSPTTAVIALIFILLVQQIQGNIITPRVMKEQADVPQFIVPIAILAGSSIGGILGAIIAVPLVAALRVLLMRVIAPMIRRYTGSSGSVDTPAEA